jgi:hypothetical protein
MPRLLTLEQLLCINNTAIKALRKRVVMLPFFFILVIVALFFSKRLGVFRSIHLACFNGKIPYLSSHQTNN